MPFFHAIFLFLFINIIVSLGIYFITKKATSNSRHPKVAGCIAVLVWLLAPAFLIWREFTINTLPTDEYMIRQLHENKEDFEYLVKLYREEYLLDDTSKRWDYLPETAAIKNRLGVREIAYVSRMSWFENPYSHDAAEKRLENIKSGNYAWSERDRRDKGVIIDLNNSLKTPIKLGGLISKSYLHLPMEPKIENGKLLYPYNPLLEPEKQDFIPVREDLNEVPENSERGSCYVKPIFPQWFIYLCRSH